MKSIRERMAAIDDDDARSLVPSADWNVLRKLDDDVDSAVREPVIAKTRIFDYFVVRENPKCPVVLVGVTNDERTCDGTC